MSDRGDTASFSTPNIYKVPGLHLHTECELTPCMSMHFAIEIPALDFIPEVEGAMKALPSLQLAKLLRKLPGWSQC